MSKPEIYVSVDVETNGPIPGKYSMLSLGAAAFKPGSTTPIDTFEVNLLELDGAEEDLDTMQWWKGQPEAWEHCMKNRQTPGQGMAYFNRWVGGLSGKPVLVTYPSWDYMWVHWYFTYFRFAGSPFGLGGLDIKSYAMALLGKDAFRGTSKRNIPQGYFLTHAGKMPPHTHKALDDAIGQGVLFMNLLRKSLEQK